MIIHSLTFNRKFYQSLTEIEEEIIKFCVISKHFYHIISCNISKCKTISHKITFIIEKHQSIWTNYKYKIYTVIFMRTPNRVSCLFDNNNTLCHKSRFWDYDFFIFLFCFLCKWWPQLLHFLAQRLTSPMGIRNTEPVFFFAVLEQHCFWNDNKIDKALGFTVYS